MPGRFISHLCGHLHTPRRESTSLAGDVPRLTSQGASLFGLETYDSNGNPVSREFGYSISALSFGTQLTLEQWPRAATRIESGRWNIDSDTRYRLDKERRSVTQTFPRHTRPAFDSLDESDAENQSSIRDAPPSPLPLAGPVVADLEAEPATGVSAANRLDHIKVSLSVDQKHQAIRTTEREKALTALSTRRVLIVSTVWGMDDSTFIDSTLLKFAPTNPAFKISAAGSSSFDELDDQVRRQTGSSMQEMIINLGHSNPCSLIIEGIEARADATDWSQKLNAIVSAFLDVAPQSVIIVSTHTLDFTLAYPLVTLSALDEVETKSYIAHHTFGGDKAAGARTVERLHELSQGVPAQIDRLLGELRTVSIDSLAENEDLPRDDIDHPRHLVDCVDAIFSLEDKYGKRTAQLLRVLSLLPQGETFDVLKRFNNSSPFYPQNTQRLQEDGLIDVVFGTDEVSLGNVHQEPQKILVVPSAVRAYVLSCIDESTKVELLKGCLDIYFGANWRTGAVESSRAVKPRVADGRTALMPNQAAILRSLLRHTLDGNNDPLTTTYYTLATNFMNELMNAARYRELEIVASVFYSMLSAVGSVEITSRICLLLAISLRMLGRSADAKGFLNEAIRVSPASMGSKWVARLNLNMAMTCESLREYDAALEFAKKIVDAPVKSTTTYQHALEMIVAMEAKGGRPTDDKIKELIEIKDLCLRKGFTVVASNIAMRLAKWTNDSDAKSALYSEVMSSASGYNQVRAIIEKAEWHLSSPDTVRFSASDLSALRRAYSYLFSQRLGGLFDRCHDAMWKIEERAKSYSVLVRLFRFGSIIWRVFDRSEKERPFVDALEMHVESIDKESMARELDYFQLRKTALLGES
jgi:tetratricopeptide (TPR) repeat protein